MKYTPIKYRISAANCPFCGAYSSFDWGNLKFHNFKDHYKTIGYYAGQCLHCNEFTVWMGVYDDEMGELYQEMIYPLNHSTPIPNQDLPLDIKNDYIEAANIVNLSPRGAAALLRLALQKLCELLGGEGKNINSDIKFLVDKGLNPIIQKALDSVRVIGNQAVHPGYLDLSDDRETALKLFGAINFIAEMMITQPKKINELYDFGVSEELKGEISKRDKNRNNNQVSD